MRLRNGIRMHREKEGRVKREGKGADKPWDELRENNINATMLIINNGENTQ